MFLQSTPIYWVYLFIYCMFAYYRGRCVNQGPWYTPLEYRKWYYYLPFKPFAIQDTRNKALISVSPFFCFLFQGLPVLSILSLFLFVSGNNFLGVKHQSARSHGNNRKLTHSIRSNAQERVTERRRKKTQELSIPNWRTSVFFFSKQVHGDLRCPPWEGSLRQNCLACSL